jgi:hypothetical protein
MSTYTTAYCYRSGGEPQIVKPADLARFIERILALDILTWDNLGIQIKFGEKIDQDDRTTYEEEQVGNNSYLLLDYDWDINEERLSYSGALSLLGNPLKYKEIIEKPKLFFLKPKTIQKKLPENIYRASISFNEMKESVWKNLSHQEQGNYLYLSDFSFDITIIEVADPQEAEVYQTGWMAFSVHGNGYLFPWTYEDTLIKLRQHPVLNQIRDICREMWPASTTPPDKEIIASRMKMGKLWSESADAPDDWYWTICESY